VQVIDGLAHSLVVVSAGDRGIALRRSKPGPQKKRRGQGCANLPAPSIGSADSGPIKAPSPWTLGGKEPPHFLELKVAGHYARAYSEVQDAS